MSSVNAIVVIGIFFLAVKFAYQVQLNNVLDASVDVNNYAANNGNLELANIESSGITICTPTRRGFIQYDLSSIEGTMNDRMKSEIVIKLIHVNHNGGEIGLYAVESDSLHEATLTATNAPKIIAPALASLPVPNEPGEVTFSSEELLTYLRNEAAGDGIATLALQITGCDFPGSFLTMETKDGPGKGPLLNIFDNEYKLYIPIQKR